VKIWGYILWATVAVSTGILVLLGYFVDNPAIHNVRLLILQWATILAAVALFLGLANLWSVHWKKVSDQEKGWPYSAVLMLFFIVTLAIGLVFGPDCPIVANLFNYIQLPVEASLMALLMVALVVAGFRMATQRRDVVSMVFVGTAIIVLLGYSPWVIGGNGFVPETMGYLRVWLTQVWSAAGARGILIGVALGSITTGLRILLAVDRPYGD
jgi:hypothetical protein